MDLTTAITAVEASQTALGSADMALKAAADKLASDQASKDVADKADADAITKSNTDLDALIAAATTAKRTA